MQTASSFHCVQSAIVGVAAAEVQSIAGVMGEMTLDCWAVPITFRLSNTLNSTTVVG